MTPTRTDVVCAEVRDERRAQDAKWGDQNHPNGEPDKYDVRLSEIVRQRTDDRAKAGLLTWRDILNEEVSEAFAEAGARRLREELIQVAAVAVAWIECIDRRNEWSTALTKAV